MSNNSHHRPIMSDPMSRHILPVTKLYLTTKFNINKPLANYSVENYTIIGQKENQWPGLYWIQKAIERYYDNNQWDIEYLINLNIIPHVIKNILLLKNTLLDEQDSHSRKNNNDFISVIEKEIIRLERAVLKLSFPGAIARALKYIHSSKETKEHIKKANGIQLNEKVESDIEKIIDAYNSRVQKYQNWKQDYELFKIEKIEKEHERINIKKRNTKKKKIDKDKLKTEI